MKKRVACLLLAAAMTMSLAACGGSEGNTENAANNAQQSQNLVSTVDLIAPEEVSEALQYTSSMELDYADGFAVDYYADGYKLVTIKQCGQYLMVPEGQTVPEDLSDAVTVLQEPLDQIYLVASATMDMFVSMDALDTLQFSGLDTNAWYIDEAKEQMESGDLLYAGKYSAPDYEMIVSKGCDLAIENTMIYHTPEVKEQLESFEIPVIVDYSSYEKNPLGRTEWVKLYGTLIGREDAASAAFEEQKKAYEAIASEENESGKTVAFFFITSTGEVNVRKTSDYLPVMIEMAGGKYVFDSIGEDEGDASSSVSMQMEEFYAAAKDADYIIYNATIEGELTSMDDLLALSPLLENFKAVKEGHVYCTTKNLYQSSMALGTIISDIYDMLNDKPENMTYIFPVEE